MRRSSSPRSISPKQAAKRLAAGETYFRSSVSPGGTGIHKSGKPKARKSVKKVNPERQAKRRVAQAKKHRAYMASETRKTVEARSGGQCERIVKVGRAVSVEYTGKPGATYRCERGATTHHHKTYARYGGAELPEDMEHVCDPCHDYYESLKPAGNRFTRNRRG